MPPPSPPPGRLEVSGYLPANLAGVALAPLGSLGALVLGVDTVRGLSRVDQVRAHRGGLRGAAGACLAGRPARLPAPAWVAARARLPLLSWHALRVLPWAERTHARCGLAVWCGPTRARCTPAGVAVGRG
jgi:hypothetical protein